MFLRMRQKRIAKEYLDCLRRKPCALCGELGASPHHLVSRGWREPRRDDFLCVPTCSRCHREIHAAGLVSALRRHGMAVKDLVIVVTDLIVEYFYERDLRAAAPF